MLSATESILLRACRGDVPAASSTCWRAVLALAEIHEVLPLVAYQLHRQRETNSHPPIPSDISEVAARDRALAIIQAGLLTAEVISILSALDNLELLVLKGSSLALRYYPPAARLSRDIDLFIPPAGYIVLGQISLVSDTKLCPATTNVFRSSGERCAS